MKTVIKFLSIFVTLFVGFPTASYYMGKFVGEATGNLAWLSNSLVGALVIILIICFLLVCFGITMAILQLFD